MDMARALLAHAFARKSCCAVQGQTVVYSSNIAVCMLVYVCLCVYLDMCVTPRLLLTRFVSPMSQWRLLRHQLSDSSCGRVRHCQLWHTRQVLRGQVLMHVSVTLHNHGFAGLSNTIAHIQRCTPYSCNALLFSHIPSHIACSFSSGR